MSDIFAFTYCSENFHTVQWVFILFREFWQNVLHWRRELQTTSCLENPMNKVSQACLQKEENIIPDGFSKLHLFAFLILFKWAIVFPTLIKTLLEDGAKYQRRHPFIKPPVTIVQLLNCVLCCDPINCSTPGFHVLPYLPEFAQIHVHWAGNAIQPSHSLLPPSSPALNLFCLQQLVRVPYENLRLDCSWRKLFSFKTENFSSSFSVLISRLHISDFEFV